MPETCVQTLISHLTPGEQRFSSWVVSAAEQDGDFNPAFLEPFPNARGTFPQSKIAAVPVASRRLAVRSHRKPATLRERGRMASGKDCSGGQGGGAPCESLPTFFSEESRRTVACGRDKGKDSTQANLGASRDLQHVRVRSRQKKKNSTQANLGVSRDLQHVRVRSRTKEKDYMLMF